MILQRNIKFVDKKRKGVKSERYKYFRWFVVSICPPGQALAGPDMTEVRVLVQFRTFRIQNLVFEVISYSFGIIFRPENSRAR